MMSNEQIHIKIQVPRLYLNCTTTTQYDETNTTTYNQQTQHTEM